MLFLCVLYRGLPGLYRGPAATPTGFFWSVSLIHLCLWITCLTLTLAIPDSTDCKKQICSSKMPVAKGAMPKVSVLLALTLNQLLFWTKCPPEALGALLVQNQICRTYSHPGKWWGCISFGSTFLVKAKFNVDSYTPCHLLDGDCAQTLSLCVSLVQKQAATCLQSPFLVLLFPLKVQSPGSPCLWKRALLLLSGSWESFTCTDQWEINSK